MRRVVFPILLGLVSVMVFSAARSFAAETFAVTSREVVDRKAVFATVQSVDTAAARSRIGGTVVALKVDEGSQVEEGERIALVEDRKLALQIKAVEARIQSLESQRELARTTFARVSRLRASGTVAQARLDEARSNLDVVDRQLAAMRAERDVVMQQREEGAVLAPARGRVLKVQVTEGTAVQPGETIVTLAADRYILRMQLPERHARFIRQGDDVLVGPRGLAATARDEAGTETESLKTGRIRQVYPELVQGRVVADVEVEGLGDYFVGERAQVHVATGRRRAFVVPADFLFQRFGVTFARLQGGAEVVVQPGRPAEGGIEVLSGLKEGDVLVRPEARP